MKPVWITPSDQERTDLAQIACCAFRANLFDAGPALPGIGCIEFSRKVKNKDDKTTFIANIKGGFPFTSTFNSQPGVKRHERSANGTDRAGYRRGHGR
ncbi:MAG TPA: hypothetical protein VG125_01775 [Pirellulales bacterium]|nr:hypothetical protein [Pirellulales bacterium]